MDMQETGSEPTSGLFDQCGKIQERLNEAHLIAAKLVGLTPEAEAKPKENDVYLESLARKLGGILRDVSNLARQLQEIERRF